MKTIYVQQDGSWVVGWHSEPYDDLNAYLDELWDSYIEIEPDCE